MTAPVRPLRWRGGALPDRTAVMAILNVTPDSFFDGGHHEGSAALQRAWQAVQDGADLLDIGGESTRPGAATVPLDVELARVIPVVEALVAADYPLPISVDTRHGEVARRALQAGAVIINDVSGGTHDPALLAHAAEHGAAVVLMHMRGTPRTMQRHVAYDDLMAEVTDHLLRCCGAATAAGVPAEHQAVDPGIGFGKSAEGCLQLLGSVARLRDLGRPVLIGASRKSFLGKAFGHEGDDRLVGSAVVAALAAWQQAGIVRVHDVAATRMAIDVAEGIGRAAR